MQKFCEACQAVFEPDPRVKVRQRVCNIYAANENVNARRNSDG